MNGPCIHRLLLLATKPCILLSLEGMLSQPRKRKREEKRKKGRKKGREEEKDTLFYAIVLQLYSSLNILRHPTKSLSIALTRHNRAHEYFDRTNVFQWHFSLASRLKETKTVAQILFAHSSWRIDFVAQHKKGDL